MCPWMQTMYPRISELYDCGDHTHHQVGERTYNVYTAVVGSLQNIAPDRGPSIISYKAPLSAPLRLHHSHAQGVDVIVQKKGIRVCTRCRPDAEPFSSFLLAR